MRLAWLGIVALLLSRGAGAAEPSPVGWDKALAAAAPVKTSQLSATG